LETEKKKKKKKKKKPGYPLHSSEMGTDCFFSPIFSYFCLFVAAFNPCQGSVPLKR